VQYLASIHEDEMVAVFLRTEIASSRFRGAILAILVGQGLDPRIVEQPNLASGEENAYRRAVLGEWRGYGRDADVFTSFPHDVRWYRALATPQDIADLRYINDDYWIELSGGTRLITDAIARIRLGIEAFHVGNGGFWYLADALCVGAVFPELILVGQREGAPLVVLEGHSRATAYLLRPECTPAAVPVLVGYAPQMSK
jgi:hypothetical protein